MERLIVLGNGTDWCEKSLEKIKDIEGAALYNYKLPISGKFKKLLSRIHYSHSINRFIRLPFKRIWYRQFVKFLSLSKISATDSICLLIYDRNSLGNDYKFLKFLKKKFKKIKFAYIFTNIVKYSGAQQKKYVDKLNQWYDMVFAFDKVDAQKYNFYYSPLIYDCDESMKQTSENETIFFVGKAKDRLSKILEVYETATALGYNCDFHIVDVLKEDQKYSDKITYNQYMPYYEAVKRICRSSILLDVIQGESTGLTIKVCEAVCYDKKLITTNPHVIEYPFYDEAKIFILNEDAPLSKDFLYSNSQVTYDTNSKSVFSLVDFCKRLWDIYYN